MHCAVTGSSNTVTFPVVKILPYLIQVTVVAGPPVEIQVRVYRLSESRVKVIPPDS